MPPNFVVAVHQLGKEEADATRTQIVQYLLRRVVTDLKARLDPVSFLNCGWSELEAFVDALLGGGMHPELTEWETTKDGAGRPLPSTREQYARRLALLLCVALERAGMRRWAARYERRDLDCPSGLL